MDSLKKLALSKKMNISNFDQKMSASSFRVEESKKISGLSLLEFNLH
jgi:hypothetical protein